MLLRNQCAVRHQYIAREMRGRRSGQYISPFVGRDLHRVTVGPSVFLMNTYILCPLCAGCAVWISPWIKDFVCLKSVFPERSMSKSGNGLLP